MIFKDTVFSKKIKIWFLQSALIVVFVWILCMPSFVEYNGGEYNLFTVKLNDTVVGIMGSKEDAYEAYRKARRNIATSNDELTLAKADLTIEGQNVMVGQVDSPEQVAIKMADVLTGSMRENNLKRSYSVKIKQDAINLSNINDVMSLLSASLQVYDEENKFDVKLISDPTREVNVLTPQVYSKEKAQKEKERADTYLLKGGIIATISEYLDEATPNLNNDTDFEDFDYGIRDMEFGDKVEIVESYLPDTSIAELSKVIDDVTKKKETKTTHVVAAGDTLGGIASKYDLTLDELISMNNNGEDGVRLEDQYSRIRPGDELIVTVPEPLLAINYTKLIRREEERDLKPNYIYNSTWYKTQEKVLQKPVTGKYEVAALVSYNNDHELEESIFKSVTIEKAVPAIIEIGTADPPTFRKPISGGRLSSGFGKRNRPTKGASSFHKGVDWATPSGTAVFASSSGTVTRAGWGSGYGYCVYIQHPGGKETRYGHLSKILVKVGQNVDQNTKIALSGNTGVSTGPHLHFEILVNGSQVDPLTFLN